MKKIILFLLGLTPFGLGFLMNLWIMENQESMLPLKTIGILFIGLWVLLGFLTNGFSETPLKSSMIINSSALLVLLLLLYQEIILKQYWSHLLGSISQFYYLPLLNLSFSFTFWISRVWPAYVVSFLIMFASYNLGSYLKVSRIYE